MKIATEKQLEFITSQYPELIENQTKKYLFEGNDLNSFNNLMVFSDDQLFKTLRSDHYLSMPECGRVWNEYFWYLRYKTSIELSNGNASNHEQPIFKTLEKLYNTCESIDDHLIDSFVQFAENFEKERYVIFDYFHPAITESGVSIYSPEFEKIVNLLHIDNFSFEEVDRLIEENIDNPNGELLIFSNKTDKNTLLKIDTYTAGEDQIHPIDILIKCPKMLSQKIDALLVDWWKEFWNRMGPFVAISIVDKFETDKQYINRKKVIK